jgi:hypothetical protein
MNKYIDKSFELLLIPAGFFFIAAFVAALFLTVR